MSCKLCEKADSGKIIKTTPYGCCVGCGDQVNSSVGQISKHNTHFKLGASLHEADQIINGERQDQYGSPEDSFTLIARYWSAYLNLPNNTLTALDVAHMMTLFKIARCTGQTPKRDNYIDAQGYLAIAADRIIPKVKPGS